MLESEETQDSAVEESEAGSAGETAEVNGPYDVDEAPEDDIARIDLGSLLVPPMSGKELRMQVEERSGDVVSIALASDEGAMELRAFAAPRNGDLWSEARPDIAEDIRKRGGSSQEREGQFGTEILCQVQVPLDSGGTGTQVSRIVGINGPRWMLRATILGPPAIDSTAAAEWEEALRQVTVRRGGDPMASGAPLPLTVPDGAQRVD